MAILASLLEVESWLWSTAASLVRGEARGLTYRSILTEIAKTVFCSQGVEAHFKFSWSPIDADAGAVF